MQGVGAAEKVFEYLDRKPKHPADGTEAPDTCTGLVEFKDITFAYPTRPETDILKVCPEGSCCHTVLINIVEDFFKVLHPVRNTFLITVLYFL